MTVRNGQHLTLELRRHKMLEEKKTAPVEEQLNDQEWTMNFLRSLHERLVSLEKKIAASEEN
jgi:hypothetical protein